MNFAVDGNSGSIHVLDDLSYQLLSGMQEFIPLENVEEGPLLKYTYEDIKDAYKEIRLLREQELLFTTAKSIEEVISSKKATDSIKALCLHVSHDCNLSCEYCFASKGDYKSGRRIMKKNIALKAVDYLVNNSGQRHNIEIDFLVENL